MSGDSLAVLLFLVGLAVTLAVAATAQAGWRHRALVAVLFVLAGFSALTAIAWAFGRDYWPKAAAEVAELGASPVAWFVLVMFLLTVAMIGRRPPRTVDPISETLPANAVEREALARCLDQPSGIGCRLGDIDRTLSLLMSAQIVEGERGILRLLLAAAPDLSSFPSFDDLTFEVMQRHAGTLSEFCGAVQRAIGSSRWGSDVRDALHQGEMQGGVEVRAMPLLKGINPHDLREYCGWRVKVRYLVALLQTSLDDVDTVARRGVGLIRERQAVHRQQ